MTPAERRALLFLSLALFLGGGVRALRGRDAAPRESASQRALAAQIAAVDSARAADGERARTRPPRTRKKAAASDAEGRETTSRSPAATRPRAARLPPRVPTVDLDIASAELIDSLPGIGPVIAARIVADRAEHGPFGSLGELERVKGVGPAMAAKLAPYVTFSGRPRPNNAHTDGRSPAKIPPRPAVRRSGR